MTDDELLNMLDQNGIDAEIEQQGPTEVGIEMPQESVTEGVLDDTDDSGFMAKSNLYKLIKSAIALHKIISDDEQLEGWVEEKITLSNDYINTVRDYLEYNMVRGAEEPASAETAPMASPAPTIKHVDNLSSSPAVKNPLVDSTELDHILKLNSRLNK